jgi:hypothetical protein
MSPTGEMVDHNRAVKHAPDDFFVRVLFNGEVVTHHISGCAEWARSNRACLELCPRETFAAAVHSLLGLFPTFKEACEAL